MLKDRVRTQWFRSQIEGNPEEFRGKVVMDVGSGTGVLAMFAAKAGARKVYAVEGSSIANLAKELVKSNGLEEVVTVIHRRVEDLGVEEIEKVDIIISEFMGFYLLHESMLDSVIAARDKFLKPGGLMLPSVARIYSAPVSLPSMWKENVEIWIDVDQTYGLDLSGVVEPTLKTLTLSPKVDECVPQEGLGSEPQLVWEADLTTVEAKALETVDRRMTFPVTPKALLHGLCVWFDVQGIGKTSGTLLSTSPWSEPTHWKQTVVIFGRQLQMSEGQPVLGCHLVFGKTEKPRQYMIGLELFDPS
mmetsp:Transcript_7889/g.12540  ORF Transcript_7889/g.12540 Transcript_7889/m.12540 type:complete len:303 (+) Transcript_7889:462-1370(+)